MTKSKCKLTLIVLLVLLAACGPVPTTQTITADVEQRATITIFKNGIVPSGSVSRFVDHDAKIVCWIYGGYGIDCLPLESTDLYKEIYE